MGKKYRKGSLVIKSINILIFACEKFPNINWILLINLWYGEQ
jgi:hypothetical protein